MKKLTKNKLLILLLAAVGIAMFIAAGLTATSGAHASAEATPYAITEQTGMEWQSTWSKPSKQTNLLPRTAC